MPKFIHHQTRVNETIYNTFRMFTQEDKLVQWFCDQADLKAEKFEIVISTEEFDLRTHESIILSMKKDEKIVLRWKDSITESISEVEITFMQCSSKTRYCTEVHVIHKDLSDNHFEFYENFWKNALDALRYYYNYDWVIEDKDLTRTKLTGKVI